MLLTARAAPAEIEEGWQAGADYYLTKPFHLDKLLDFIDERTHFGRNRGCPGELAPPVQCSVEVGRPDDDKTADVLLGLGKRTIGDEQFTLAKPHDGSGTRRMQPALEDPCSGCPEFLVQDVEVLHDRL